MIGKDKEYKYLKLFFLWAAFATALAKFMPPRPPLAQTSLNATSSAPACKAIFFTNSISFLVSNENLFIATTQGILNNFIFSICFSRLEQPSVKASRFSEVRPLSKDLPATTLNLPLCIFNARIVQTRTTTSGLRPLALHFILKNFSAPQSAPNPLSVTTKSANFTAILSAKMELFP